MSLRTDDIEGARPKYFERQKLIAKAQQYNNSSNIFTPSSIQQNIPMRNPDIYSSQVLNQGYQQAPQQSMQQIENNSQVELNPQVQGREKSMYQLEYQAQSPSILQNNRSSVDYARGNNRNPIYHYSAGQGQGSKMLSEKQYQEQLVLQEMKKFKDQQQLIEQEKRRRELEFREQEIAKKQREQEQLRIIQQQQEEKLRIQRQQEEEQRIQEREQQLRLQEEIRIRDQQLKEKERQILEQEMQVQQQRKSANVNRANNISQSYAPEQYADDIALMNQINQQQAQISQPRAPSNSNNPQSLSQPLYQQGEMGYPEVRKTPIVQEQQIKQSSTPANAKYFNTPLPSQYRKEDQQVLENQSQVSLNQQQQQGRVSQLAAKSILSPMSAILKHNNELPNQNQQQIRPRQKPVRVLAIIDSDSKMRELVNKFFNVRGVYEFELFSLPGSAAGLINDKGWRDTFFSCFSFMRQQYDFSDIYVFTSIDSAMIPLWYEQNNSNGAITDKQLLKNYHIECLKQAVNVLSQNVSQVIKLSSFLFDNRGGSEKIQ